MVRRAASWVLLCSAAAVCQSQPPPAPVKPSHFLEIHLPLGFRSDRLLVRYKLAGEEFGGWADPPQKASSLFIDMTIHGRAAEGIKAILYAPGCAIETLDLALSETQNAEYDFLCKPLRSVTLEGTVTERHWLSKREIRIQAKYAARWARSFLELSDPILTTIPLGEVELSPEGRFRLSIPDLSQDPLAGAADHPGDIQIWATDSLTRRLVAQLVPAATAGAKAQMGGLALKGGYSPGILFVSCTSSRLAHDAEGFAIRSDSQHPCDRR